MKDLDAPAVTIDQFSRSFRFRMVTAYPVVSDVPDVYAATHDDIDAGFQRCLDNRHLRRVAELWLTKRQAETVTP